MSETTAAIDLADHVHLRDGFVHLETAPSGPRRYQVSAAGRPVGSGKGCSVDMYLLAVALDAIVIDRRYQLEQIAEAIGTSSKGTNAAMWS